MLNGVIFSKLQTLDQVLRELRSLGQVSEEELRRDWRTRRAIERDLQVLAEVVIDVCQRVIACAGQAPAPTSADAIERCVDLGALGSPDPYRTIAQFRNFIVHRYEHVDVSVLVDVVNNRLHDFDSFGREIQQHATRST